MGGLDQNPWKQELAKPKERKTISISEEIIL